MNWEATGNFQDILYHKGDGVAKVTINPTAAPAVSVAEFGRAPSPLLLPPPPLEPPSPHAPPPHAPPLRPPPPPPPFEEDEEAYEATWQTRTLSNGAGAWVAVGQRGHSGLGIATAEELRFAELRAQTAALQWKLSQGVATSAFGGAAAGADEWDTSDAPTPASERTSM